MEELLPSRAVRESANTSARADHDRPAFRLLHVTTVPMSLMFLRGQVGFMKSRGAVVAAVSAPGEELDRFGAQEEVEVHAVPMTREITPLVDLASLWTLIRLIRAFRPDVVHGHTPKGGLLAMLAARAAGVPVRIYHMRGLPLTTATGLRRRLLSTIEKLTCILAHEVICVSRSLRAVAIEERLAAAGKLTVLGGGSGNGVDSSGRFNRDRLPPGTRALVRMKYGIPEDAPVVGFVGRLVRDKGIDDLMRAWMDLSETEPDLHLLVVGPLEPRDPVAEETVRRMTTDDRIHQVGESRDTPDLYAAMDLVVLPSYREGFPNVPLEAASMGLPVVATQIPGCIDAVEHGVTGTLVEPGNVPEISAALRGYIRDEALRVRHGSAGRARVIRDFAQMDLWTAMHAVYIRHLQHRGRRTGWKGEEPASARRPGGPPTTHSDGGEPYVE